MAQYKTGTATFTNGSSTVTGSGTAWASNLKAGDDFVRKGDTLTTYPAYEVGAIVSDTELTLTAPYGGDSAIDVEYVAHIDFQADGKTPKFDNGDIETASIFNKFGLLYSSIKAWVYELFVSSVDSIADLPLTGTTGQKVNVTGYYVGSTKGGGNFVYDATKLKSDHDGLQVFSPTAQIPADGTNQSEVDDYLSGANDTDPSGSGCWIRLTSPTGYAIECAPVFSPYN